MLTKLLEDVKTLANDLPNMKTEIEAVQADLADPKHVDIDQLDADVQDLYNTVSLVQASLADVVADIGTLPQAAFDTAKLQKLAALVSEIAKEAEKAGNTRLQNLLCLAIPFLNMFLAVKGFPNIPTPAFCTTPTP